MCAGFTVIGLAMLSGKAVEMKYSYSTDQENYIGEFDSATAAALEAFNNEPDIDSVWVGENRNYTAHDFVNAIDIIEQIIERACDECGEHAEDWLDAVRIGTENLAEFKKLVGDWIQSQEPPKFWTVDNEREICRGEAKL